MLLMMVYNAPSLLTLLQLSWAGMEDPEKALQISFNEISEEDMHRMRIMNL